MNNTVIQAEGLSKLYRRGLQVDDGLRHSLEALPILPRHYFWKFMSPTANSIRFAVSPTGGFGLTRARFVWTATLMKSSLPTSQPWPGGHEQSLARSQTGDQGPFS